MPLAAILAETPPPVAGKESVALDFRDQADQLRLRALLAHADIVIESARPRALEQMKL